jgi:hypothetical protein
LEFKLQLVPQRRPKPELQQRRVAVRSNYCFNLKNRFPVGGVTVTLFVPLAVFTVPP